MRLRVLVLTCVVAAGSATSATGREAKVLPLVELKALTAKLDRQPMIFFVAKGAPNACGPGCNEWIAAEGALDRHAGKRFNKFVEAMSRTDLPIFFNSMGGSISQAREIATVLRAKRMKAGVARTIPEGCRGEVASDQTCRRLIEAKSEPRSRLITKGAKCSSACGYAFAGASFRQVAADAQIYIHAAAWESEPTAWQKQRLDDGPKRFFAQMGIDPGLVDLINSVPFERIRPLTRAEMLRFGVETRAEFETRWLLDKEASSSKFADRFSIRKSVTRPEGPASAEFRTTRISIGCPDVWKIVLGYQRETLNNERSTATTIRLGDRDLRFTPNWQNMDSTVEALQANVDMDLLRRAAAEPVIEITGYFTVDGQDRSRVTKVSTDGLTDALTFLSMQCLGPGPVKLAPAVTASLAPVSEARGPSETPWTLEKSHPQFSQHFFARKSVTRPESDGSNEYRTTRITIACADSRGLLVTYRRELAKGEGVGSATMHFGGSELQLSTVHINEDTEMRRAVMKLDLLQKAIAEPAIEISEKRWLQGEYKSRVTKISTAGLSDLPERCGSKSSAAPASR